MRKPLIKLFDNITACERPTNMQALIAASCIAFADPLIGNLEAMIAKTVEERFAIPTDHHIRLVYRSEIHERDGRLEQTTENRYEVWKKASQIRIDSTALLSEPPVHNYVAGSRTVGCQNCELPQQGFTTRIFPSGVPRKSMVEFHPAQGYRYDPFCVAIDWRFFGLKNSSLCEYPNAKISNEYLAEFKKPERTITVADAAHRGTTAVKISAPHRTGGNSKKTVVLNANDGNLPVYFLHEWERVPGQKPLVFDTVIEWQTVNKKFLFPRRIVHQSDIKLRGKDVRQHETITFEHVDFISEIPAKTFTLAGVDLNEGQAIGLPNLGPGDQPLWLNGRIDPQKTIRSVAQKAYDDSIAKSPENPPLPGSNATSPRIPILAGVLSMVAAIAAIILRRQRKLT
jgi:hypothetical protein